MTISNELNKLIQTKEAIRQSIINKGTDVDTDVPFSQYASKIDEIQTSPVEYMQPEFYELRTKGGTDYTGLFAQMSGELDLSGLNTSTVENMYYIFYYNKCNLNCSNWDVSNVTNIQSMFYQFDGNIDISNWKFDSLINADYMFYYAKNTDNILGINDVKLPNATSLRYLFGNAKGTVVDLSNWDINKVTNLSYLFDSFDGKTIDLSGWNTFNVTDMSSVFKFGYNSNMEELIIPDWDMTNVTKSSSFFPSASYMAKLRLIDLSNSNDLTINKIISYLPARTETTYGDVLIPAGSSQEVIDGLIAKYWRPVGVKLKLDNCNISAELDEVLLGKSTKIVMGDYLPWYANRENNIEYVTSDNNIATIDEEGNLTAHALGNVEVYVRLKDTQEIVSNTIAISIVETYSNPNEIKFKGTGSPSNTYNYIYVNGNKVSLTSLDYNNLTGVYTYDAGAPITSVRFNGIDSASGKLTCTEILKLNTSNITNMTEMLSYCQELTSLDTCSWDVGNVTNMSNMFDNCISLISLDLSNWDVSNVRNMQYMFSSCSSLTSIDLSNWQIGDLIEFNMVNMFSGCISLIDIKCDIPFSINKLAKQLPNTNGIIYTTCDPSELDMETIQSKGWTVEKLEPANTIKFLTKGSKQLVVNGEDVTALVEEVPSEVMLLSTDQPILCKYVPNGDITSVSFAWNEDLVEVIQLDTSKVENMGSMFYGCSSLQTIPDLDVTNAKWMDSMFNGCISLTGYADPEKYWNNPNIISFVNCFKGCASLSNFNELPSDWGGIILLESISLGENVSTTEDTYQLVCTFIPEDTTQRNIEWMIDETSTVATLDQNGLLTRIGYGSVWVGCRSLDVADVVHHIEVTFEEDTSGGDPAPESIMFVSKGSTSLTVNDVDVTDQVELYSEESDGLNTYVFYPTSNVETVSFKNNTDLVRVVQLNTSGMTRVGNMFYGCTSLESIPQLDTSSATTFFNMFYDCTSLQTIPDLDLSNAFSLANLFYNCSSMAGYADPDKYWNSPNDYYYEDCFTGCTNLDNYNDIPAEWGGPSEAASDLRPIIFKSKGNKHLEVNDTDVTDQVEEYEPMDVDGIITYIYQPTEPMQVISFYDNTDLTSVDRLPLENIGIRMNSMFDGCTSLTSIDVGGYDLSSILNTYSMFYNCESLTYISFGNAVMPDLSVKEEMFTGCSSLTTLDLNGCGRSTVEKLITGTGLPTYDIEGEHFIIVTEGWVEGLTPPQGWSFDYQPEP